MLHEAAKAVDLCVHEVVVAPRSLSIDQAARLMREKHVGCLVVVEQGDSGRLPAGLVTDRDIVTAVVAKDADPKTLSVQDVMSASLASVDQNDSLFDILQTMRRHGVRRLPVTGPHGVLAGIVSLDDVYAALAGQMQAASAVMGRARAREVHDRP